MANIVIYPKNIYSKPKYDLQKRNIIKNPDIDYKLLLRDSLDYTQSSDFEILNNNRLGTELQTPLGNQKWYLNNYEDNNVIPYRHFYFTYGSLYYNYVIAKWNIAIDNDLFLEANNDLTIEGDKKTLTLSSYIGGKLVGFYSDFDIDNLEITYANKNNFYNYDESTQEGTFAFTYKNFVDHIEVYMILGLTFTNITLSTQEVNYGFNFSISKIITFNYNSYNIKYNNNINSDYTLKSNEFVTEKIGQQILEQVYNKYKNGRKSVTLSVYADNYYDENGNIVYDKTKGEIIRNGDIIKLYEYKNNGYKVVGGENVRYKVTSSEFEYKGQPIIHLELLEEK